MYKWIIFQNEMDRIKNSMSDMISIGGCNQKKKYR